MFRSKLVIACLELAICLTLVASSHAEDALQASDIEDSYNSMISEGAREGTERDITSARARFGGDDVEEIGIPDDASSALNADDHASDHANNAEVELARRKLDALIAESAKN